VVNELDLWVRISSYPNIRWKWIESHARIDSYIGRLMGQTDKKKHFKKVPEDVKAKFI
jgi:hypothetical protein